MLPPAPSSLQHSGAEIPAPVPRAAAWSPRRLSLGPFVGFCTEAAAGRCNGQLSREGRGALRLLASGSSMGAGETQA